ncbi:1-acyl-sn-glycerol-3-phosphate acyltransferase [Phytoactinopolyspora alkaliphila]|uniref:1-acyl-sn-glycerol-3-phosphate acyltransferase n=1 Tax=Phytoactinopolyspora alkaliphila TaxID=1783498 RepID=A0A6N9YPB0_9ACTN|nr:lysophospholipid acyltransferase family protein [Phytoactinopolyspora alkaliphila]NED96812.1 1-acyl-sn-glycerol-3-phosphate acyltransferase [Phytoactinopolyspora alkaliphila]
MELSVASTYWRDVPGPSSVGARVMRPVGAILMRAVWNVRVHHAHLVPREDPVILASNHTGILDGPLLYSVTSRPVHALVKREMFAGLVGSALRWIGQIPVDRSTCDVRAVKNCLAVLHRGGVIAVYPEGTRGLGDFALVKPGAAYMALCTGAPIVPVAALGVRAPAASHGSLPRVRSSIDIVFGEPIATDPVPWPRRQHVVRERTGALGEQLREHVRQACALTGRALTPNDQILPVESTTDPLPE